MNIINDGYFFNSTGGVNYTMPCKTGDIYGDWELPVSRAGIITTDIDKIVAKLGKGELIVDKTETSGCLEISVVFKTSEEDLVDIILIKYNHKDNAIEILCFDDVHTEDSSHKYSINIDDVYKIFQG